MPEKLLEIKNLSIAIKEKKRSLHPVRGVSFFINKAQRVCLVGESGCGKTLTAFSIMRLLPDDKFSLTGSIEFDGKSILDLSHDEMRRLRGKAISMIFQEPMTALNPVFKIGDQIVEAILVHERLKKEKAKERAINMLFKVGVPEPDITFNQYPHELSGGLRQRAMIAMALSCSPNLLIADEPTTALDVTIQAQILDLLRMLSDSLGLTLLLITHNLGVVAQIAQKVLVMYSGKIVEESPVKDLFKEPLHPYTKGLIKSVPYGQNIKGKRLYAIPGHVPGIENIPDGCAFYKRCKYAKDICQKRQPELLTLGNGRRVACHLY